MQEIEVVEGETNRLMGNALKLPSSLKGEIVKEGETKNYSKLQDQPLTSRGIVVVVGIFVGRW